MRRRIILAAIVAIIVAFGGAATATVVAQSRDRAARELEVQRLVANDARAIQAASREGVTDPELAALRAKLRRLSNATHVHATWILGGPSLSHLRHQNQSLHSLRLDIRQLVASVQQQRKREAVAALSSLRTTIRDANRLLVDVREADRSAQQDQIKFAGAHSPREYRAVADDGSSVMNALSRTVAERSAAVHALLHSWKGDSRAGVQQAADSVQAEQPQLDLLVTVRPSAGHYQNQLQNLLGVARGSSDSIHTAAAVLSIQETIAGVVRDFKTYMPAKAVVVYTASQSLSLYDHAHVVLTSDVTTGGPGLETDRGVYHIYFKASPFTFHSPWPPGSPYYYLPTDVQYWMPFDGGQGLHDASWRSNFGPGSNFAPTDLGTGNYIQGTHGCVNLPLATAQYIWDWAPVGTSVIVM